MGKNDKNRSSDIRKASNHHEATTLREATILRQRRESLGLTQKEIATEAGIDMRTYQRYEYGIISLSSTTMKVGLRICAALELDPYEVVFENGRDMAGVGRSKAARRKTKHS